MGANTSMVETILQRIKTTEDLEPAHEDLLTTGLHLIASLRNLNSFAQSDWLRRCCPLSNWHPSEILRSLGDPLVALIRFSSLHLERLLRLEASPEDLPQWQNLFRDRLVAPAIEGLVLQYGLDSIAELPQGIEALDDFLNEILDEVKRIYGTINLFIPYMVFDRARSSPSPTTVNDLRLAFPQSLSTSTWGADINDVLFHHLWSQMNFIHSDIFRAHFLFDNPQKYGFLDLTKYDWYSFANDRIHLLVPEMQTMINTRDKKGVSVATRAFRNTAAAMLDRESPPLNRIKGPRWMLPHCGLLALMARESGSVVEDSGFA